MNLNLPPGVAMFVVVLFWLATALVHIAFAVAVFYDAQKLDKNASVRFVPPLIWSLATLIGGVITAGIYWAIHHSSLRPAEPKE